MSARPSNIRIIPRELRLMTALQLFRMGFDTADIAFQWNCSESYIYNLLSVMRERENDRKIIYAQPAAPSPSMHTAGQR